MIDLNLARKYRDVRCKAQAEVDRVNRLPARIAGRLTGLNFDDMSMAEKQIADLLGREGLLFFDENGDCMSM